MERFMVQVFKWFEWFEFRPGGKRGGDRGLCWEDEGISK